MAHAIVAKSVSKTFVLGSRITWPRRSRRNIDALIDVSFIVNDGEVFGLVGRNGYGKTTLLKCICSLVEPTRGTIEVFGIDTRRHRQALRRAIGYVGSDERSFYWRLTGRQNLRFFGQLHGLEANRIEQRMGALSERFEVSQLLDRRFQEYSTGNRQRLSIVRALLHEPRMLILDEPTRSLDPFAANSLRRALVDWVAQDAKRSVLITSHNLAEVEQLSDRVGIMSRGRLLEQGSLAELRARFDDRERVRIWFDDASGLVDRDFDQANAENLQLGQAPDGSRYVGFRHQSHDDAIDAVIRRAQHAGAKIRTFERIEMSLQDIIDRVDGTQEGT